MAFGVTRSNVIVFVSPLAKVIRIVASRSDSRSTDSSNFASNEVDLWTLEAVLGAYA